MKPWRGAEELARCLEAALAPDAEVRSNVQLPVLGSATGRTRQCDVVIILGPPDRRTTTIVEVQKRTRKPTIGEFHGWIAKMREVGAQHLICVSERGFPDSVIEEVRDRIGPTVRLLTLQEVHEADASTVGFPSLIFRLRTQHITLDKVYAKALVRSSGSPPNAGGEALSTSIGKKLFRMGEGGDPTSLDSMVRAFAGAIYTPKDVSIGFDLSTVFPTLQMLIAGTWFDLGSLAVNLTIAVEHRTIPIRYHEYRQELVGGVLAWVLHGEAEAPDGVAEVRAIFRPEESGNLRLASVDSGGRSVDFEGLTTDGEITVVRVAGPLLQISAESPHD